MAEHASPGEAEPAAWLSPPDAPSLPSDDELPDDGSVSATLKNGETDPAVDVDPHDAMNRVPGSVVEPSGPRRSGWGRLGWVVGLGVLVAVAGGAWWVGSRSQSPDQAAARASEPVASWVTVPVELRVLASTVVTRGDVQPVARTDVGVPASVEGVALLTRTIVAAGDVVGEGDRVAEVSGRPVFVLQGEVPVYRTLLPGMVGDDVGALQAALVRLGFVIPPEELRTFGASTKDAVAQFYAVAGYQPIVTSETYPADRAAAERAVSDAEAERVAAQVALEKGAVGPAGSVVAQADAAVDGARRAVDGAKADQVNLVALAQQSLDVARANRTTIQNNPEATADELNAANVEVTTAEVALADAVRDTADALAAAQAELDVALLARRELDSGTATTELETALWTAAGRVNDAAAALAELDRVNGPTVPLGEVVFVSTVPARVLSAATALTTTAPTGATPAGSSEPVVSLATGGLAATATVSPDQVGLVNAGLAVELLDELRDTVYPATVTLVAEVATPGADGRLVHVVTITPTAELPDTLAGSNLRVTMTAASTGTEELVVPLAAVSSGADGSTRVNIVDPVTGEPVVVEVVAGLSADGFVAITPVDPDALVAGSGVIVGR